jgi:hypothetical protein
VGGAHGIPRGKEKVRGIQSKTSFKGIVSPDWKGLQMVSLDRFEV